MRVLILGLPGSGTSAVAECFYRAGYADCPPTYAKGDYPYDPHESIVGRAVNRTLIGESWIEDKWRDDFVPPAVDFETIRLAEHFIRTADDDHGAWFFKNPESLIAWEDVWSKFRWDRVVGVYRHPEESIRTLHSLQKACYRRTVWKKYMRLMAYFAATEVVKFPDDIPDLSRSLGVECPLLPGRPNTRVAYNPGTREWCSEEWAILEDARCRSTFASAT